MCERCTTSGSRILRHQGRYSDAYQHEVNRIEQFKEKARDDAHFKQMVFNRAAKCGPAKREKFIETLRRMERDDLASFVEMCFKNRNE